MIEPMAWMALGMALVHNPCLSRLVAELRPEDFENPKQRELVAAIKRGAQAVREALSIDPAEPGKVWEILTDRVIRQAKANREKAMMAQIRNGLKVVPDGEDFIEYLERKLSELKSLYSKPGGAVACENGRTPPTGGV